MSRGCRNSAAGPRREHGDRHLYRARAELRALCQHHRSVPGGCAHLEALCLRRAAMGAAQDGIGRCFDAVGSNIRIDARGGQVLRVLPRLNEDITRNGSPTRRAMPSTGSRSGGLIGPSSGATASSRNRPGRMPSRRSRNASKPWTAPHRCHRRRSRRCRSDAGAQGSHGRLGSPISMRARRRRARSVCRAGYLFNTTIAGIEQADACLLIGTNPRLEAAILNARLRKRWLAGGFKVALIGPRARVTYSLTALGSGPAALADCFTGNMNGPRC